MIPYIRAHIRSWHIANDRKESHHVLDCDVGDGHWMERLFNSYPYDLILLYWFLSGNIFWIWDFLPDKMVNLWIFTQWLTSAGWQLARLASDLGRVCQKVHLYGTFLCSLRHSPPQMKNQHWLNEGKNLNKEKKISQMSACDVTCVVSLDPNNQA